VLASLANSPHIYRQGESQCSRSSRTTPEGHRRVIPPPWKQQQGDQQIPLQLQRTRRHIDGPTNQSKRGVGWEPCLVGEQPGAGRLMGSLRGRGGLEGRVQRCTRRRSHSSELTWRTSTTKRRRIKSGSEIGEGRPDRKFIFDCFQESLAEAANTEHVEGTTTEED